ncbi:hypothetical protein [Nostoc piscinale]|uniref:hypothetical protein n=1 Tax=Nostoc piscinale TaxID=224012 RepID=UPI0011875D1E|nr:hypothetical protein [Nostoc piscinale]
MPCCNIPDFCNRSVRFSVAQDFTRQHWSVGRGWVVGVVRVWGVRVLDTYHPYTLTPLLTPLIFRLTA